MKSGGTLVGLSHAAPGLLISMATGGHYLLTSVVTMATGGHELLVSMEIGSRESLVSMATGGQSPWSPWRLEALSSWSPWRLTNPDLKLFVLILKVFLRKVSDLNLTGLYKAAILGWAFKVPSPCHTERDNTVT